MEPVLAATVVGSCSESETTTTDTDAEFFAAKKGLTASKTSNFSYLSYESADVQPVEKEMPLRKMAVNLIPGVLLAFQVALLLLWTMTSNCQSSATMTLPAADIYLAYQVLAASQFCAFCFFRILWRGTDPASSMAWSLQAYLFVGWSYWLLGAAVQLTTQCGMHLYGQQTLLMLHRANCASLEFIFAYSIQSRLELTENGFGVELGARRVRQIRWLFFLTLLGFNFVRLYGEIRSECASHVLTSIYHGIAGVGVLATLFVALRAFLHVANGLKKVTVPEGSIAACEQAWSLMILNRMTLAVCVSGITSSAFHILGMPSALFLLPGEFSWKPLVDPFLHLVDISVELAAVLVIGGALTPQEPCAKQERTCMRGFSRLVEDLPNSDENAKVRELAMRSIDISTLLDFYAGLGTGGRIMQHFDPSCSTTNDVVRQAIIPASRAGCGGVAFADLVSDSASQRPMANCMVTHSWSNLFVCLVAAVIADALGLDEYAKIETSLRHGRLENLRRKLSAKGVLCNCYWICCFCVNQHSSICDGVGPKPSDPTALARWLRNQTDTATRRPIAFCDCTQPKLRNDDSHCEMNKFDRMMMWIQYKNPDFRQMIAVDRDFEVFQRAWCVAELVAAHGADLPQVVCLESSRPFDPRAGDLAIYDQLVNLSVVNSLATRPEDKEMILSKVSSVREFDAALQRLIFGNRGLLAKKFIGFDSLEPAARFARRLLSLNSIVELEV